MTEEQNVCPLEIAKKLKSLGIVQDDPYFCWVEQGGEWYLLDQTERIAQLNHDEPKMAAPQLHDLPDILRQLAELKKDYIEKELNINYLSWVLFRWNTISGLWFHSPKKAWACFNNLLD